MSGCGSDGRRVEELLECSSSLLSVAARFPAGASMLGARLFWAEGGGDLRSLRVSQATALPRGKGGGPIVQSPRGREIPAWMGVAQERSRPLLAGASGGTDQPRERVARAMPCPAAAVVCGGVVVWPCGVDGGVAREITRDAQNMANMVLGRLHAAGFRRRPTQWNAVFFL